MVQTTALEFFPKPVYSKFHSNECFRFGRESCQQTLRSAQVAHHEPLFELVV